MIKSRVLVGLGILVALGAAIFLRSFFQKQREKEMVEYVQNELTFELRTNEAYWLRHGIDIRPVCSPMYEPIWAYRSTGQGYWSSWVAMAQKLMSVPYPETIPNVPFHEAVAGKSCLSNGLFALILSTKGGTAGPAPPDGMVDSLLKEVEHKHDKLEREMRELNGGDE